MSRDATRRAGGGLTPSDWVLPVRFAVRMSAVAETGRSGYDQAADFSRQVAVARIWQTNVGAHPYLPPNARRGGRQLYSGTGPSSTVLTMSDLAAIHVT